MRVFVMGLLCLVVGVSCVHAQDTTYLSGMEDMPLMPGLEESLDDGMLFDQPEGRIVLSVARCVECGAAVGSYYRTLLPALGWQHDHPDGLVFRRGKERLVIEVQAGEDGHDMVSFALAPGDKP